MAKKIEITNETNELNFLFGGYFSGRGNVLLHKMKSKKGGVFYLKVSISFDDMKIAKLFQENFGGKIKKGVENIERKKRNGVNIKEKYEIKRNILWVISCLNAMDFLSSIQPFIIEKKTKKKIDIAINYCKFQNKNLWRKTEEIRKQRNKFYLQMRRLK